jgi:hypothetical protein
MVAAAASTTSATNIRGVEGGYSMFYGYDDINNEFAPGPGRGHGRGYGRGCGDGNGDIYDVGSCDSSCGSGDGEGDGYGGGKGYKHDLGDGHDYGEGRDYTEKHTLAFCDGVGGGCKGHVYGFGVGRAEGRSREVGRWI